MKRTSLTTYFVAAVAAVGLATPVFADQQHTRRGNAQQQQSGARSGDRGTVRGGDQRSGGRVESRGEARPRTEVVTPRVAPREYDRGRDYREYNRGRDYRGYDRPSYRAYEPRYRSYGYGPVYRPYVFRPRLRIGLGLFLGYPVPYSDAYSYPVRIYGYGAPAAPVIVGPAQSIYGGVALEIMPNDAEVWVDGGYAGIVRDFDGTRQPLTLAAGTHRIELRLNGYQPSVFDVTVEPGQVIPYQGELQPY